MINISDLHDKLEKIIDNTKTLIVYKQMGEIGKMISATMEARIQDELIQKYKDLGIQTQEDPIAKFLETINEMHFDDISLLNVLNHQNKIYLLLRRE